MKRFPELSDKSQRGSKPRCHLWTDGPRNEVAGRLSGLVEPFGSVNADHESLSANIVETPATLAQFRNQHGFLRSKAPPCADTEPQKDDDEPFEEKMKRRVSQLHNQQDEAARRNATIETNLAALGFGWE